MGRPKLGYHLKRDRGDRSYLIVEGYTERFTFDTRNPTKAQVADALAYIKRANAAPAKPEVPKDTLRWLFDEWTKTPEFKENGERTQHVRKLAIERLLASTTPIGKRPRGQARYADVTRSHIYQMRDELQDTPEAANERVKLLRGVYKWAVKTDKPGVLANPARDVELLRPKVKFRYDAAGNKVAGSGRTGNREWTLADIRRFIDHHRDDPRAMLAISLLLYTGVRISDVVRLGRPMEKVMMVDGQRVRCLHFKATKGAERRERVGKEEIWATVPIVPEFAKALEAAPKDSLVYLLSEFGRPYASRSFGNRMRKWCDEIVAEDGTRPMDGLSSHGMRKASAQWWVDNYQAENFKLKAIFGWLTDKEANHYTQGFDRQRAAASTLVKFPSKEVAG
jgi:integrase